MFSQSNPRRFNLPCKSSTCNKLIVDGISHTDGKNLLNCWRSHFQTLGESKIDPSPELDTLSFNSLNNDDTILSYDASIEELESVVRSLKNGKSCGADGISSEHLKYGGPAVAQAPLQLYDIT